MQLVVPMLSSVGRENVRFEPGSEGVNLEALLEGWLTGQMWQPHLLHIDEVHTPAQQSSTNQHGNIPSKEGLQDHIPLSLWLITVHGLTGDRTHLQTQRNRNLQNHKIIKSYGNVTNCRNKVNMWCAKVGCGHWRVQTGHRHHPSILYVQ